MRNKKKAVILLNMGGISRAKEIKIFLKNMFSDKNIINIESNFLRKMIASLIVKFRIKKAKQNYKEINNFSPLLKITKQLIKKLQNKFPDRYITMSMRYTPPFSKQTIKDLQKRDIKDIFLLPMYPQYSTTTIKSSLDDMVKKIETKIPNAKISYIKRLYTNKKITKLIVDTIEQSLGKKENIQDYNMIFSAHSLPVSIIENGDSYERELEHQIELIKKEFAKRGLKPLDTILAYQSKLGPVQWLEPSLEYVIKNIPFTKINKKKTKKTIIYPISFFIDNAETIQELDIEVRAIAKKEKYTKFILCEAFNTREEFVDILEEVIL